jgi:hypothetical protein
VKRLSLIALLALVACNSNATVTAVSLPGPNALAVGGRTLFVANTDADELRALNLSTTPRTFVRAPNPLYPLGIPTAPFPRALAAFTGTDGTTPVFSFALSTAGAQVTVVSNETLAALGAFVVPDTTLAIATTRPVTATDVRLVLAAVQGSQGALWTASLSADLKKNYQAIPAIKPAPAISLGASSPQVLVPSPSNPDLVAV